MDVLEYCTLCDELTNKIIGDEDSLYDSDGNGPYCDDCYDDILIDCDIPESEGG